MERRRIQTLLITGGMISLLLSAVTLPICALILVAKVKYIHAGIEAIEPDSHQEQTIETDSERGMIPYEYNK